MSNLAAFFLMLGLIIFLICIRIPVPFAMGSASVIVALIMHVPLYNLFSQAASGMNTFSFMAVPFFMIMGQIMTDGNISKRLVDLCNIIVGRIRGGTAVVNILVSMLFGGISGSAIADVSSIGAMLIPAMEKEGYDPEYSVAVTVTSSVEGVIIPPSQNMIFWCIYANAGLSITTMLVSGYLPGVLLTVSLMVPAVIIAHKRQYPISPKRSARENVKTIREGLIGLFAMVIVIVGTTCGICSATESAALAAVYCLIVSVFVYRNVNLKIFWKGMINCVGSMTMVMCAMVNVAMFRYMLSYLKVAAMMVDFLCSITTNATLLMLMLIAFIIVMGCFTDMGLLLIMLTPIVCPIATSLGYNPYHIGIVFILAMAIGLVTPPVGNCIILGCSIAKIPAEKCVKDLLPFVGAMVVCDLILLFVPQISTFLPSLLA